MYYLTYSDVPHPSYPIVILVPSIRKEDIKKEYIDAYQIPQDDVLVMSLH